MNINEIRMDDTNLISGFDMRYKKLEDVTRDNGVVYDCYVVDFEDNQGNKPGFKQDNYRLLITS